MAREKQDDNRRIILPDTGAVWGVEKKKGAKSEKPARKVGPKIHKAEVSADVVGSESSVLKAHMKSNPLPHKVEVIEALEGPQPNPYRRQGEPPKAARKTTRPVHDRNAVDTSEMSADELKAHRATQRTRRINADASRSHELSREQAQSVSTYDFMGQAHQMEEHGHLQAYKRAAASGNKVDMEAARGAWHQHTSGGKMTGSEGPCSTSGCAGGTFSMETSRDTECPSCERNSASETLPSK